MICKLIFITSLLIKIIYAKTIDSVHDVHNNNVTEQNISLLEASKPGHASAYARDTTSSHWSLGIVPYYIDHLTYDDIITRRVRMAIQTVQDSSCVVFKQLHEKPAPGGNGSWLHFTNPSQERECIHDPITGTDEEIVIILGFECMQFRDVLHSLLHAIGFMDEVSHPQRDQFIRVLWENIQPKYRPLFRMQYNDMSPKALVEYDPLSIMHFHDRAYSSNGGATIAPLIPGLIISPSDNLSQLDKMKLGMYFGHECNKRKVGDLLDTCKNVLYEGDGEKLNENGNIIKVMSDDGDDPSELKELEPASDEESHGNKYSNESHSDGNLNENQGNESEHADNESEEYTKKH